MTRILGEGKASLFRLLRLGCELTALPERGDAEPAHDGELAADPEPDVSYGDYDPSCCRDFCEWLGCKGCQNSIQTSSKTGGTPTHGKVAVRKTRKAKQCGGVTHQLSGPTAGAFPTVHRNRL